MTHNEALQKYIESGFRIFPVHYIRADGTCSCGKENCGSAGKHPMTLSGVKDATSDAEMLASWCIEYGEFNIGISTENLCVIDIDNHNGIDGRESYKTLCKDLGEPPATLVCFTGGGGIHLYYSLPAGKMMKNRVLKAKDGTNLGVDIRGEGGYVVAPPSNHKSGGVYRWKNENARLAEISPEWLSFLTSKEPKKASTASLREIKEGGRNDELYRLACSLRSKGLVEDAIEEALKATNLKVCVPPLSDSEVSTILNSALKHDAGVPRTEQGAIDIERLTSDNLISQEVGDYIAGLSDITKRTQELVKLEQKADEFKMKRRFTAWVKDYTKIKPTIEVKKGFEMPLDLDMGEWAINAGGVFRLSPYGGLESACTHPIQITKRIINVETSEEKIVLTYFKDGSWKNLIVDKRVAFDQRKIVELIGKLGFTSETAKTLVAYLFDLEKNNIDKIPVSYSISRLGWLKNREFIPYNEEIEFDGEIDFQELYGSVKPNGDCAEWLSCVNPILSKSPILRLVLDCSISSVLLDLLNLQIYFMHVWGETETGKSVAMHVAMSVWGDPQILVRSWNSTPVALEKTAGFLHNLPLALDERQVVKNDRFHTMDTLVYMLSAGQGKGRGTKYGGVQTTTRWNLSILSNGEQPLIDDNGNGGAKNRVLDVYCENKIISDGNQVIKTVHKNYGHVGKKIIECIQAKESKDFLANMYGAINTRVTVMDKFTDKQINSISVIILADALYNHLMIGTEFGVAVDNAVNFVKNNLDIFSSVKDIKPGEKEYEAIINWISANQNSFSDNAPVCLGMLVGNKAYINSTELQKFLESSGFNYRATLKALVKRGYLEPGPDGNTKPERIYGRLTRCAVIHLGSALISIGDMLLTPTDEDLGF